MRWPEMCSAVVMLVACTLLPSALLAAAPNSAPPPTPVFAVAPTTVADQPDTGAFLTGVLLQTLRDRGGTPLSVPTPAADCDAACMSGLAQDARARALVVCSAAQLQDVLAWTCIRHDADGAAPSRHGVHAQTLQSLVAQAHDLADQLCGTAVPNAMETRRDMRQLGFTREQDLAAFRAHRLAHATLSTREALTSFLLERNRESERTSLLEAVLLTLAPALLTAAVSLSVGVFGMAFLVRSPMLSVAAASLSAVLFTGALAVGLAGLAVVARDALDIGHVGVRATGCCRDDDALAEGMKDSALHRAAAVAVLMAPLLFLVGAMTVVLGSGWVVAATVANRSASPRQVGPQSPIFIPPAPDTSNGAVLTAWTLGALVLGTVQGLLYLSPLVVTLAMLPAASFPFCLGVPIGLGLLFKPPSPMVEPDPEAGP